MERLTATSSLQGGGPNCLLQGSFWALLTICADVCFLLCDMMDMRKQPQSQTTPHLFAIHNLAIHAVLGILCIPVVHKLDEGQATPLTCTHTPSVSSCWQSQAPAGTHPS